ncbi:hypothetical protein AAMO2058_000117600 [Amorphochlora amoebiformis]
MDALLQKKQREELGSLGAVIVGLLVLVAIGGAYSLRSYPVPQLVGQGTYPPSAPSLVDSFRESCEDLIAAKVPGMHRRSASRGPNELVSLAAQRMSAEEFMLLVAFFGTLGEERVSDPSVYTEDLPAFLAENVNSEGGFGDEELFRRVNCTAFAVNMLEMVKGAESMGHLEPGMLGVAFGDGLSSLTQALNIFTVWLHKGIRKVIHVSLRALPGSRWRAPKRRRGSEPTPAPVGCIGRCFSC